MGDKIKLYLLLLLLVVACVSAETYYVYEDDGQAVESNQPVASYTINEGEYSSVSYQDREWKSTSSGYAQSNYGYDSGSGYGPDYNLLNEHLAKVQRSEYIYDDDYQDYLRYNQGRSYQWYDDWRRYDYNNPYDPYRYDTLGYNRYYDDQRYRDYDRDHDHNWRYPYYGDSYRGGSYSDRYYNSNSRYGGFGLNHKYAASYYRYNILNYDGDYLDYLYYKMHKRCYENCYEDFDNFNNESYERCRRSCKVPYYY
ncbi:MAG: hypothetical protein QGH47_03320 [Candidatus Woesearchaeota archaeon]|jgi:hypothetical protein|nr:hypothetical protein [Candidatus Woesearchaeota archaeon]